MIYAPVIIPTLNRSHHLARCLESLANNTLAEFTELYISVDYPPNEKYFDGYFKVKQYLNTFDVNRFKKVYIYYQETNLGPSGNFKFLLEKIKKKYDRYISSEDDNEFAPNFLEYINKGLEIYKNEDRVIGICGAHEAEWLSKDNKIAYVKIFSAYGCGQWMKKNSSYKNEGEKILLNKESWKIKCMIKLFKTDRCLFTLFIEGCICNDKGLYWKDGTLSWVDSLKSIYMHYTDCVCVVPQVAKSRTWGNDGSGVNMPALKINPETKWPLDKEKTFNYSKNTEVYFIDKNYMIENKYMKIKWTETVKAILYYLLLIFVRYDRSKVLMIKNKIKKIIRL